MSLYTQEREKTTLSVLGPQELSKLPAGKGWALWAGVFTGAHSVLGFKSQN